MKNTIILSVSGNKVHVCYHLCIRHTLDMVFELHQSSAKHALLFSYKKEQNYIYAIICSVYLFFIVICVF